MPGSSPGMTAGGPHLHPSPQRIPDLVQHLGILDGRGHRPCIAVGDLLDGAARILPERVFGSRPTVIASLNAATGPSLSRTSATISFSISACLRVTPAFSTRKPQGTSPLLGSVMPSTAHSATSG